MRFSHLCFLGISQTSWAATNLKKVETAEIGVGTSSDDGLEFKEVNGRQLVIPDYDEIIKDFENPYRDSGLVLAQNPDGKPAYGLLPSFVVEKKMCSVDEASGFKTWSTLKLVSTVHGLTAGSIKIGDDKATTQFIHMLPESDFIHLPSKAFERIAGGVGLSAKHLSNKPYQFKKDLLKELPPIEIQFANTQLLFTITPDAYTRCEEKGDMCVLLIKLGNIDKTGFWFLGRPFFDYVVASISLGNTNKGYYHVCAPKLTAKQTESWPVKFAKSKVKVGMPWTPNDYVIMALVIVFVVGLLMYLFRHRLTCWKRGGSSGSVHSTPRQTPDNASANDDTRPLLTNTN